MKKKLVGCLVFCTLCTALVACGGCDSCGCGDKKDMAFADLYDINLRIEDDGIVWNSIANAQSYKLYLNGKKKQTFKSDETFYYAVPETVGEYTVKIVMDGKGYVDDLAKEFTFQVANMPVSVAQLEANAVEFGEAETQMYYRLSSSEEWTEMNSENYLDFSSMTVGTPVALEYYSEGKGWEEETSTYYLDSEVQSVSFSVKEKLASAELMTLDGQTLSWAAVAGAGKYVVEVDGVPQDSTATSVALPQTLGEHVVSVYAVASDENAYASAKRSFFNYTVAEQKVDIFTVNGTQVVFDAQATTHLQYKTTGDWSQASTNVLNKTGLSVKYSSWFDATQNIVYTESKPLKFMVDTSKEVTFDKAGKLSWTAGEGKFLYKIYEKDSTEPDQYVATSFNEIDLSVYQAGGYDVKYKTASYIVEGETEDVYHESGDILTSFIVLATPSVTALGTKLTWETDVKASGYVFGTDKNNLAEAPNDGYANITGSVTDYYVQAVGSEEAGAWSVNSPIVKITADATLQSGKVVGLANFSSNRYMEYVTQPINGNNTGSATHSILDSTSDTNEQAILSGATGNVLKVVAGNASPRNSNETGNCDGVSFNLFEPLSLEQAATITIRLYIDVEGTENKLPMIFGLNGTSKQLVTAATSYGSEDWKTVDTKQWITYTIDLSKEKWAGKAEWGHNGLEDIKTVSITFQDCGQKGYTFYIDSITYAKPTKPLTTAELEAGYTFTQGDEALFSVKKGAASFAWDETKQAVKVTVTGNTNRWFAIALDNVTLSEGDKLVFNGFDSGGISGWGWMCSNAATANKWIIDYASTITANGAEITHSNNFLENMTEFGIQNWDTTEQVYYFKSVEIVRAS